MVDKKRFVALELAHADQGPAAIMKALRYLKSIICDIYKRWSKEGMAERPRRDRKRMSRFVTWLKRSIKAALGTPMSTLVKNCDVSISMVNRAIKNDLGMKYYKLSTCHILTNFMRDKRDTAHKVKKTLNLLRANKVVFWDPPTPTHLPP